jgi:ABC-type multidrug transport system ATPase subunit
MVAHGVRIDAEGLGRRLPSGDRALDGVSFSVQPGKLVAIVGGSGAGKTTLLEALAGVRPADEGTVRFDGVDVYANLDTFRAVLGYVPQDDIIHADLPLERTLRYAARLRLAPSTSRADLDAAVHGAMATLDLSARGDVRVAALSGGQRKRASIAVELLTRPHVFFLDEPTSGLDPATGAELVRVLRSLADEGATVVFTTHAVQDLRLADEIVFLAPGGRLVFDGPLDDALAYFEVAEPEEIYERVATEATPAHWAQRFAEQSANGATAVTTPEVHHEPGMTLARREHPGFLRQWTVLTARAAETMVRNKLTLAILLGSPALVIAMFAVLFKPGAFVFAHPSPSAIVMIIFWITFGSFFFGLTYGLLQICTERAILRREYLVGLRLSSYLLSKIAVLLPFLIAVNIAMLVVLRALDRLPARGALTYTSVAVGLGFEAAAALALGLLTSAAVTNPSQATLALPMLCFPAVLFSGAILPVHVMAAIGQAISAIIPVRWGFEALGHELGVRGLLLHGGSPLGRPLVATYGDAGTHSSPTYWLVLATFTTVFLVATWMMLRRTARRSNR